MEKRLTDGFTDWHWNQLLEKAVAYQQHFYELIPNWTIYKRDDYKLIKQNIGYAICGSPNNQSNSDSRNYAYIDNENITDDTNINDLVRYSPEMEKIIDNIFTKILKYGNQQSNNDSIQYGIIYNMIFRNKVTSQREMKDKEEIIGVPVFKIKHYVGSNKNNEDYNVWYIDIKGRVYTNWKDYILNNNFPKCTMVYPKDGYYKSNPEFNITPSCSTVWLIAQDSYKCSSRAAVIHNIDNTIHGIGTTINVGLGVASLFTPAAPLCAAILLQTGMAAMGVQGTWTAAKCATDLYDKGAHDESISPFDRNNLSSWLGLVGFTVGVTFIGSTVLLKNAAAEGVAVSRAAMMAYDIILVSNISINLVGVGNKTYEIYNKYNESGKIDTIDIVYLGTHLLFFMNSVINIKFAKDIIDITQGEVLKEFEKNLRDDNLRQHYEYAKKKANMEFNENKMEENAAVIRNIKTYYKMNDLIEAPNNSWITRLISSLYFEEGKLTLNGIVLIDPMSVVVTIGIQFLKNINKSNSQTTIDNSHSLTKLLEMLLTNLYTSNDCPSTSRIPIVNDFECIINELKNINNSVDILPFIFNTAVTILKSKNKIELLVEACRFIWDYIKEHMKNEGYDIFNNSENSNNNSNFIYYMESLFHAIFEAVDSMVQRFFNALQQYIKLINENSSHIQL
ncbi:hypothetical protein M0802_005713 [Mischocyttarus mexicanus]|nr:hypothetical protein M0802_005713 [Mischocyttarus mexicanus]